MFFYVILLGEQSTYFRRAVLEVPNMRMRTDGFQSAAQGMSTFFLLLMFWIIITLVPIGAVVGAAWLLMAPAANNTGTYLIVAVVLMVIFLLIAWFLRWLARGIMQGKKVRIGIAALAAIALSLLYFSLFRSTPSASIKLQMGLWAAILLFFTFGLVLSLFEKARSDET